MSSGHIPLAGIYLLTFVTALHAAALNKTAHTDNQMLPADHLQPAVEQHAQEVKVEQVNSLNIDTQVDWTVLCIITLCLTDVEMFPLCVNPPHVSQFSCCNMYKLVKQHILAVVASFIANVIIVALSVKEL